MSSSTRTTWAGTPTITAGTAASRRLCDAGSTGSATFAGLRHVLDTQVRTRVRAFVNLSAIGIVGTSRGGELSHRPYADPEGCARTIIENPDLAIGVKLRYGPGLVWEYTTEPVKMARRTAAMAGVPLMIHVTDSPIPLPDIVAEMAPGDIVTHCYHGRANGIMGPEKQFVLKEIVEAQRHGIIFDCAHGRNHFSFPMIEKALDQGFLPDTISTDLTLTSATKGPVWDLATTMSKLLHFGMSLDDLVTARHRRPGEDHGLRGHGRHAETRRQRRYRAVGAPKRQFPDDRQRRQHGDGERTPDRPHDAERRPRHLRAVRRRSLVNVTIFAVCSRHRVTGSRGNNRKWRPARQNHSEGEALMALNGVLRPGYIQIRVLDIDAAADYYVNRVGLHEVSREADGRVYLRAWDEFDRHSIVLRPADMPGMDYVGFKVAGENDLDTFRRRIEEYRHQGRGDRRPASSRV